MDGASRAILPTTGSTYVLADAQSGHPNQDLLLQLMQQQWGANHWLLQYDLMFGKGYALSRMGMEGLEAAPTGK